MKTAIMSMAPLEVGNLIGKSEAGESAVDAYASRILETMSPPEAFIDTSLGPYVTSLLRCSEIQDKEEVSNLAEFDSLIELLEDQCSMERGVATDALKTIANAVCTGTVPDESYNTQGSRAFPGMGLYAGGGLDSFQTFSESLPETPTDWKAIKPLNLRVDPFVPSPVGAPSPIKMEALVPEDLLGALDNPSPNYAGFVPGPALLETIIPHEEPQQEEVTSVEEAFPPLGASMSAPPKKSTIEKTSRGKKKASSKNQANKDLAAALFRPARPRQNSIEVEDVIGSQKKHQVASSSTYNKYFQQQWDSCVEILLSMNHDLSEEAALEAGLMANADFNVAQYLVDSAISAKPVCRHMLHDGCYRSDCQFSHDVEGHTCLFWLRGRCGKGTSCKFLHGFNPKLLDGIDVGNDTVQSKSTAVPIHSSNNYGSPYQASSGPPSDSFTSYSLPTRGFDTNGYEANKLGSPWQSMPTASTGFSFANIASKGYDEAKFASPGGVESHGSLSSSTLPTVRIPQDLWNPHENRDASVFHIPDPIERYNKVSAGIKRRDVVDLHFQSTKTFVTVLSTILPQKLAELDQVWIVTGTGHHVGSKTHQKGGGALERAVTTWLIEEGYNCFKGKDRNGLGGAVLVKR